MNTQTNLHDFTNGAKINSALSAIGDLDLQRIAPSVFAEKPIEGVSKQYNFVRTIDVINKMREAGFGVVRASQSQARTEDGKLFTKHAVRLVQSSYLGNTDVQVGHVIPEIVLTNSHDRTSAFHLSAGLYRILCSNMLTVAAAQFRSFRVLHNDPSIYDHIIDGTNLVREITDTVALPTVDRMMKRELTKSQELEFSQAATYLKFGEVRPDHATNLLTARRAEDEGRTLWAVLNRIQENAVKGGYTAQDRRGRNIKVRGITAVDRDLDFNTNLWTLGSKVLELA